MTKLKSFKPLISTQTTDNGNRREKPGVGTGVTIKEVIKKKASKQTDFSWPVAT